MQWTGCLGEETHGGDRVCGGGCNGQGVMVIEVVEEDAMDMVWRDVEVIEVVEDAMDRVSWWREMQVREVVEEDAMDRISW